MSSNPIISRSTFISPCRCDLEPICVRIYPLDEGQEQVKIYVDSLGALKGVWSDGKTTREISSDDLEGIPMEERLNPAKLSKLLIDSYASLLPSQDGSLGIRICFRCKGGGNGFSSAYTQTAHSKQLPPPSRMFLNYTAGFPIRKIECPAVPGGEFVEQKGGLGQNTWSVVFVSQDLELRPRVKLFVWKKDYHLGEIGRLTALKDRTLQELAGLQGKVASTARSIQEVVTSLLSKQQEQSRVQQELDLISTNLKKLQEQLVLKAEALAEAEQSLRREGPSIRSLLDFLAINDQLGFPVDHPAISGFLSYQKEMDSFVGRGQASENLLTAVVSGWEGVLSAAKEAKDKEIVAVVGCTGVGKSTLVNHLLHCQMRLRDDDSIEVADLQQEMAKIGHGLASSETLLAQVCTAPESLVFADCGGFFDTRDSSVDILISASVKQTIVASQGVKLLLCMSAQSLKDKRGGTFTEGLSLILKGLFKDPSCTQPPIVLLLTRPHMKRNGTLYATEDALKDLGAILAEVKGKPEEQLYEFVLRGEGKYVHVYDPLSDASREVVYGLLGSLPLVQDHKKVVGAPYTTQSIQAVLDIAIPIASKAQRDYETFDRLRGECVELRSQETKLNDQRLQLEQELAFARDFIRDKESSKTRLDQDYETAKRQEGEKAGERDAKQREISQLNTEDFVIYESSGGAWSISGI